MCLLAPVTAPSTAWAGFDEFADEYSPKNLVLEAEDLILTIKGEVELEFHDLEGEGGTSTDSPTDTQTIGTRSPYVEIDSFWLALRVGLGYGFAVNSFLEFTPSSAGVGAVWFDFDTRAPWWLRHHVEAGYHTPIVKTDRHTERYPLIASAFWRSAELHLAYELFFEVTEEIVLELGASLAMMRPLDFVAVQESTSQKGTIRILAASDAAAFSGNGPVGGGRAKATVYGAFVEGFGFVGALSVRRGVEVLRSGLSNYQQLPDYPADIEDGETYWWAGGRVGFDRWGIHALVEGIYAREHLLERWGGYAQLSYRIEPFWQRELFWSFEPLVRVERYRIVDGAEPIGTTGRALRSPAPIDAVGWDWDIVTIALIVRAWREFVTLRVEYYFIDEANGSPALGVDDVEFRNDELMVQAELRF